jgi:hypothetical protein
MVGSDDLGGTPMLHPTDLIDTIAAERQRAARQRAEGWRELRRRRLDGPVRPRRLGIPRVALG